MAENNSLRGGLPLDFIEGFELPHSGINGIGIEKPETMTMPRVQRPEDLQEVNVETSFIVPKDPETLNSIMRKLEEYSLRNEKQRKADRLFYYKSAILSMIYTASCTDLQYDTVEIYVKSKIGIDFDQNCFLQACSVVDGYLNPTIHGNKDRNGNLRTLPSEDLPVSDKLLDVRKKVAKILPFIEAFRQLEDDLMEALGK